MEEFSSYRFEVRDGHTVAVLSGDAGEVAFDRASLTDRLCRLSLAGLYHSLTVQALTAWPRDGIKA